jgi:hypothetical protein
MGIDAEYSTAEDLGDQTTPLKPFIFRFLLIVSCRVGPGFRDATYIRSLSGRQSFCWRLTGELPVVPDRLGPLAVISGLQRSAEHA